MPRAKTRNQQPAQITFPQSEQDFYNALKGEAKSSSAILVEKDLSGINESVEKYTEELSEKYFKENTPRYTEVLGVFVALFTFVSIEVQIFNKLTSLVSAGIFTLLMFICLVGFLLMLHLIIYANPKSSSGEFWDSAKFPILGLVVLLALGSILIYLLATNEISINEEKDKKIEEIEGRLEEHDSDIENLKTLPSYSIPPRYK